jgi:ATP-dependent RNA helicase HelY
VVTVPEPLGGEAQRSSADASGPVGAVPAPYAFELDDFQRRAVAALDAGQSVLVAAPTGSGKTVVAEHAVELALARPGEKVFYTTPIKALSNQKFHDLVRRHGPERVGLLTGDNAINGTAPVVVMTTEVLRNMIYARSEALSGLRYVVLDEVHYLQDAYRGPVWEEVMVHLPADVRLVCLSATVSNATELADWIATVRGPTATIVEQERPVELVNLYAVSDRTSERLHLIPTLLDGRPNPEGHRFDPATERDTRGRPRRKYATPRRLDVIDLLAERDLLPAIFFIFSRVACDDAMRTAVASGVRLTDPSERARIRAVIERHTEGLSDVDLEILGYGPWATAVESGVAAHHAGMVPAFKEAVEECFAEGLVKVVFATETLALGINMPARTVVIERLTKFTGERHEFLTPGQYTQLTGRAGRRGIDRIGHAIVVWSPFVPFGDVAGLAASRSFVLTSAFRPTYNMAANLVRRYEPEQAHHLLNLSFAQYQADRAVVRLETRLAKREAALAPLRQQLTCELGDTEEFVALLEQERHTRLGDRLGANGDGEIDEALRRLRPGDVIVVRGGKNAGRAAVVSVAQRRAGTIKVKAVTEGRRLLNLGTDDFPQPPGPIGTVTLPEPFAPGTTAFQRQVAESLRHVSRWSPRRSDEDPDAAPPGDGDGEGRDDAVQASWQHPVGACPDRDQHVRAARQAARATREIDDLRRQIAGRTESLARTFDRVLRLLEAWGHLSGWSLTPRGDQLVRLYHECDLLIAEALESGLLDGLDPASLAGLVSCFTYEHRSPVPPPEPWYPSAKVRHRVTQLQSLAAELNADEDKARLPLTRTPDPSFFALAHAWAAGETLEHVLDDEDVSSGDFVRNMKQLIDLLRQLGEAARNPATARTAREAADRLFRGVVALSSAVSADPGPGGGGEADEDVVVLEPGAVDRAPARPRA